MRRTHQLRISLAALVLIAGCSNDSLVNPGTGDSDLGDLSKPVVLEILGNDTFNMQFNASQQLTVRARYNDGLPAAGRAVLFTISGASSGSTILAPTVYTDNSGIAVGEVLSGQTRTNFLVLVSSGNSNQVQFTINVLGNYLGQLRVYYSYSDVVPLNTLSTRIHPQVYNCATGINWAALPPWDDLQVAPNATSAVIFQNLPEGQRYTVTVRALGPAGNEVARGCAVSDEIVGQQLRTVTVPLTLLPVDLRGQYEIGAKLRLPEMLPDDGGSDISAADVFNELVRFFDNPGAYLYQLMSSGLASLICGGDPTCNNWVSSILTGGLTAGITYYCQSNAAAAWEDAHCLCNNTPTQCGPGHANPTWRKVEIGDWLNILIVAYTPAWVTDIFLVGDSLVEMASNLTVGGILDVTQSNPGANNSFNLQGTESWTKYMFTWKLNNCVWGTIDPCCGRYVFGEGEQGLTVASAPFTGVATKMPASGRILYDVDLEPHTLALNYGNIIVYLLENVVFPDITGFPAPVTMGDMLIYILPVAKIACQIDAWTNSGNYDTCVGQCTVTQDQYGNWVVGGSCPGLAATVISLCEFAGNQINGMIEELQTTGSDTYKFTLGTSEDVAATNTLEDKDKDLKTDELFLTIEGTVHYGSNVSDAVSATGTMSGDELRPACTGDNDCGDGKSCQIKRGLVNECAERQVCLVNVGTRTGGTACNNNNLCQSGWCMPSPRICFAACNIDDDCPANMTCHVDQYDFDFGGGYVADVSACAP